MVVGIPLLGVLLLFGLLSPKQQSDASQDNFGVLVSACKDAVRSKARFESKLDFHQFTAQHFVTNGKEFVRGKVDMMNGFGAMIPNIYECEFKDMTVKKVIFVAK